MSVTIVRDVTINNVREVSRVPEVGAEVGAEVAGDEVHGRPVSEPPDGGRVHAALVEQLQLPELTSVLLQPEDQI